MHDELMEGLQDVAFTIPTPFTADGSAIDREGMQENVRFLRRSGAKLYVPCGNTGEYYALSDEERVNAVQMTADAVGEDDVVLASAGGHSDHVINLGQQYKLVGADAVLVMHPGHTHLHERGLVGYFREIADELDVPIVIYKRGSELTRQVLVDLSEHDNVIGVKYAASDLAEFSAMIREASSDVVWINGIAERYAPTFALEGATGYTTGIGNFLPEQTLDLFDAIERRDWDSAIAIRDELAMLEELRDGTGEDNQINSANNVPVVKYGMELAGLSGGPTREPLVDLDDSNAEMVEREYASITDDVN